MKDGCFIIKHLVFPPQVHLVHSPNGGLLTKPQLFHLRNPPNLPMLLETFRKSAREESLGWEKLALLVEKFVALALFKKILVTPC